MGSVPIGFRTADVRSYDGNEEKQITALLERLVDRIGSLVCLITLSISTIISNWNTRGSTVRTATGRERGETCCVFFV